MSIPVVSLIGGTFPQKGYKQRLIDEADVLVKARNRHRQTPRVENDSALFAKHGMIRGNFSVRLNPVGFHPNRTSTQAATQREFWSIEFERDPETDHYSRCEHYTLKWELPSDVLKPALSLKFEHVQWNGFVIGNQEADFTWPLSLDSNSFIRGEHPLMKFRIFGRSAIPDFFGGTIAEQISEAYSQIEFFAPLLEHGSGLRGDLPATARLGNYVKIYIEKQEDGGLRLEAEKDFIIEPHYHEQVNNWWHRDETSLTLSEWHAVASDTGGFEPEYVSYSHSLELTLHWGASTEKVVIFPESNPVEKPNPSPVHVLSG